MSSRQDLAKSRHTGCTRGGGDGGGGGGDGGGGVLVPLNAHEDVLFYFLLLSQQFIESLPLFARVFLLITEAVTLERSSTLRFKT